nr:hypothetical protein [Tanacetum cinerariifolium]
LTVDHHYLEQVARQGLDLAYFTLKERVKFADPLLMQLGRQLLTVADRQHTLGALYAESLIHTLCYHLIEYHGKYERRLAPAGKLSAAVLARLDAYVEAHLRWDCHALPCLTLPLYSCMATSSPEPLPFDTDVLIIGAGPIGLTTANALRHHSVACRLLEEKPTPSPYSRANNVWARPQELLDSVGLRSPLAERSYLVDRIHLFIDGHPLDDIRLDETPSPFPQAL